MKVDNLMKLLEDLKWQEGVVSHIIPPTQDEIRDGMRGALIISFDDGTQQQVLYDDLHGVTSEINFGNAKMNDRVLVSRNKIRGKTNIITHIKPVNPLPSKFKPLNKRIDLD